MPKKYFIGALDLIYLVPTPPSRANEGVIYFRVVLLCNMEPTAGYTFTPSVRSFTSPGVGNGSVFHSKDRGKVG